MKKKQLKGWALFWAVLFLVLLSLVTVHAEGTETEDEIQLMPEESVQQQLDSSALAQSSGGESAVFGIAVMNKQKSVELSWDGNYTSVVAAGFYKNQKPSLVAAAPSSTGDMQVIEAWRVQNLKNNTLLSMTARLNSLPTLGEGESLAFYALNSGSLSADPLLEDLSAGDLATIQLYFKGYDGIALVRMAADPADLPVENNFIWANEDIYLTGKMPGNAVVDATPVTVEVDGEFVLAAYDVKIYTNAKQREKGKTWQPSDKKVQVHFFNEEFKDGQALNIYHMADTASQPELVDTVTSEDNWITFEAESFSVYAITVIEKTVEASNGDTYKITVAFDTDSGIPADAQVEAEEISTDSDQYKNYLLSAADALGVDVSSVVFSRLFDISLVGPDGTQYQPNDTVSVTIQLLEKEAQDVERVRVVHFADESAASQPLRLNVMNLNSTASVQDTQSIAANGSELSATTNGSTVTFDTDGFSMFALVDFTTKENMVSATFDGETVQKLYEDDNIIISGSMPPHGIVEAIPAQVQVEGENSLIAYDIKIYANADMKNAGINWQPSAGALTVQVNSNILENGKTFSVYHMEDADSEPVLVAKAEAADHAITFEAESFSIYPVVEDQDERIAYRFYDGTTLLATEYMRSGRQLYSFGEVGAEYGKSFVGWAYTSGATTVVDNGTMNTLNEHLATGVGDSGNWQTGAPALYDQLNDTTQNPWVATAGSPITKWSDVKNLTYVNVFAVFENAYYLRYMHSNDNGSVYVINTVRVLEDATDKTVTIDQQPTSPDQQEKFEGWIDVADPNLTVYEIGNTITLDHHIDLYEKYEGYNWLVFDSNKVSGSSATYTPPQFLNSNANEKTEKPDDPEMKGYYFTGWNTEKNGSGTSWLTVTRDSNGNVTGYPVDLFGDTLAADTILYAQWDPAPQKYYVVFWQQSVDDEVDLPDDEKTYVYVSSEERDSTTGTTVNTTAADRSKGGTAGSEYGYYFTYNSVNSDTTATVSADGTTILNVYYDRKEITYTFSGVPTYTATTYGRYGLIDGEYVQLYYYSNRRYSTVGINDTHGTVYYRVQTGTYYGQAQYTYYQYSDTRYSQSTQNQSYTGLYGATFTDWPDPGNGKVWTYGGYLFPLALTVYDPIAAYNGNNPDSFTETTIPFTLTNYSTNNTLYIYVQTEDGSWSYTNDYLLSTASIGANGTWYPTETFIGFVVDSYQLGTTLNENGSWTDVTSSGSISYSNTNVYLRYIRNQNKINFVSQGPYVNQSETVSSNPIYYGAPVSTYTIGDTTYSVTDSTGYIPTNGIEGYFFAGWYEDETCLIPYDFSDPANTMLPNEDITVYAKWATLRTRVVLIPTPNNAHNSEVFFPNDQALKFRKDYGETIDDNNIKSGQALRTGYKLEGWYTEPEFIHKWVFSEPVTDKATGVNSKYQETADWANNTYGDNDGKHDNVTCILKLYAKWTLDVDTTKVYIKYVVPEEYLTYDLNGNLQTTVPIDPNAYSSEAFNHVVEIGEKPAYYMNGYIFNSWELMNADGSPSGVFYTAGGSQFIQNVENYIQTETVSDDDGKTAEMKVIYLRATFRVDEGGTSTLIRFNGNNYAQDDNFKGFTNDAFKQHQIEQSYLVNQDVLVIPDDNSFVIYNGDEKKEGFALVAWSFDSTVTAAQAEAILSGSVTSINTAENELTASDIFAPGSIVYADNETKTQLNNGNNTIYAVWKRMLPITITKTSSIGPSFGTSFTAPLEGAEFTIYSDAACTEAVTSKVSGSDGKLTLYLKDIGIYYMKETTVPEGFEENSNIYTINVTSIGVEVSSTAGDVYTITADQALSGTPGSYEINNTPKAENKVNIVVKKVDANTKVGLSGAKFTLYYVQSDGVDALIEPIDFGANTGYTIEGLPSGTYKLVETSAPANYLFLNSVTEFKVDASGETKCEVMPSNEDALLDSTDPSGKTIIIQNHPMPAPTGIDFRILPYLFMLGAGLALMMGLRYGKKRQMN